MVWNLFGGGDKKQKTWRDEAPSLSQLDLAKSLDIPCPEGISQGELSDLITKKKAARDRRTGGIISELKKEVAQLKKDVGGLKKTNKKTTKKVAKKKKK